MPISQFLITFTPSNLKTFNTKRTVTWMAECINSDRTNCYLIFDKQYLDIPLLQRISKALNHNFFNELAAYMESVVKLSTEV